MVFWPGRSLLLESCNILETERDARPSLTVGSAVLQLFYISGQKGCILSLAVVEVELGIRRIWVVEVSTFAARKRR